MTNVRKSGGNVRSGELPDFPDNSGAFEIGHTENLTCEMSDFPPGLSDREIDDWRDPLGRVSDARSARLLGQTIFHVAEQRWSPDLVHARLQEMARVLERVVSRPGPRYKSTVWPADVVLDFADQVAMVQTGALEAMQRARNTGPMRLGADDHEISRAEQAIGWIARYLNGDDCKDERDALQAWLTCETGPETWERASTAIAGTKRTANRRRRRAFEIICNGLINDGELP